ncbi:MAG: signal peptidase II [Firmicutes bacterium]|nr:signal peptidase II [Bacillota bacterium]
MFWICFALVVLCDQGIKYVIGANMQLGQSLPLIKGLVDITYVLNKGAAFSILQGQRWIFIITTLAVLVAILWFMRSVSKNDKLLRAALALFCGGALGNFIDRLRVGAVTDFIDFHFFPIFNIADSCIVIGAALLGWCLLIRSKAQVVKEGIDVRAD